MSVDLGRLLSVLAAHRVDYVLVGGAAAVVHGSTIATEDVDITPAPGRDNLDRLGRALRELGARIRTEHEPDGVEFPCDGRFLAAIPTMLDLTTDAGDVDLVLAPPGFPGGYDELAPRAVEVDLDGGLVVMVAALDDLIAAKRSANRPKDQAVLPYLEALADEIARGH